MEPSVKRDLECRVFLGNLDYHTTSDDIISMLSSYGKVVDVYFPISKNRKPPKLSSRERSKLEPINYGCAFVEFKYKEDAKLLLGSTEKIYDPYARIIYISTSVRTK